MIKFDPNQYNTWYVIVPRRRLARFFGGSSTFLYVRVNAILDISSEKDMQLIVRGDALEKGVDKRGHMVGGYFQKGNIVQLNRIRTL